MRLRRAPFALALAAATLGLLLSGCSPTVALDPAAHANDPVCADVIVRLPATVRNLDRRDTNAQSTGAWGDPAEVLLRCGVAVPTASDLPCVTVDDQDWLRDASKAPHDVYTSYGRTPAIAVVIDERELSASSVLSELSGAVAFTKPNGHKCLSAEDSLDASPSPTPSP
ncbi:MAG: DUF3515 family protein [Pseudolysinimonas sp.]